MNATAKTGVTVEIDSATQFATAYRDGKPVATLARRRTYEQGPAWKVYALDGSLLFETMFALSSAQASRRIAFHLDQRSRP